MILYLAGFSFFLHCWIAFAVNNKPNGYQSLGCWSSPKQSYTSDLIPSVEGTDDDLEGFYWDRVHPVMRCARVAKHLGYKCFAVRNGGECLSSGDALDVYRRHGLSEECYDGEGGHDAMDVYELTGELPEEEEFEGDIILTKVQQAMTSPLHEQMDVANTGVWERADYVWPDRTVPYYIPPKLKNHQLAQKMLAGIRHWEEQTCIKFVPKTGHRDWVQLHREENPKSSRCASAIGRIGRNQQMRLGDLCPAGSVIHEWGHSIGFWHTHSRPDRDDYVEIIWDNIVPGMSKQFKKYTHGKQDTMGVKYDYQSIMHYGKDFFGKISKDKSRVLTTVRTKRTKYQNKIGQRLSLSKNDILMANRLYGCPDFPYMWRTRDWGECSVKCGAGVQKRKIYCAQNDGKAVPGKTCKNTSLPEKTRKCYGKQCRRCPRGWYKLNKVCYRLVIAKRSWMDAKKSCRHRGSGMLTIRNDKEEQAVRKFIKKHYLQTLYFWLGVKYSHINGSFLWADETHLNFSSWRAGEPRWGMDCGLLMNHEGWGTDRCEMTRSYICKKELHGYKTPVIKASNHTKHRWYAEDWSECSVTCGGGQKHRTTFCAAENKTEHVAYSNCTDSPPDAWKDCNTQPCPSPYKWHVKKWDEPCSKTCGGGYKRREVICAKPDMLATAWEMCNHTKRPPYSKTCNNQPCPTEAPAGFEIPDWKASHWTRCSATCGTGRQLRRVICARRNNRFMHHKHCSGRPKPSLVRLCSVKKKCVHRKQERRCINKNVMCRIWRRQKLCGKNKYVTATCQRSCGTC